jgi:hypothetical protein
MDSGQFDSLTRAFANISTARRGFVSGTLGGGLTTLLVRLGAEDAEARKRKKGKKRKKKKIKRNEFGCVNVGKFCKNGGQCCSGICQGKKGKNKCKAHDSQGCQAGQQEETCNAEKVDVPCTTSAGEEGICDTTTGNAGYCRREGDCFPCSKDADCQEFCGPAAACIICADFCAETGGTGCVGPGECTFPPS